MILFLIIYYAILNPMVNDRKAKYDDKLNKQNEIAQFDADIIKLKAFLSFLYYQAHNRNKAPNQNVKLSQ